MYFLSLLVQVQYVCFVLYKHVCVQVFKPLNETTNGNMKHNNKMFTLVNPYCWVKTTS